MTAHLTIPLDDAQKAQLETIAEFRNETAEAVVSQAVQDLIAYDQRFREAVEKGRQDVREGRAVPHEEVVAMAKARRLKRESASGT
jgi:predicted transcriptional regulator